MDVMTLKLRKTAENHTPVHGKTMCVSTANNGDNTSMRLTCASCGANMDSHDIYDPDTGETVGKEFVCPNKWKMAHE
jgi:hypothetical protein